MKWRSKSLPNLLRFLSKLETYVNESYVLDTLITDYLLHSIDLSPW